MEKIPILEKLTVFTGFVTQYEYSLSLKMLPFKNVYFFVYWHLNENLTYILIYMFKISIYLLYRLPCAYLSLFILLLKLLHYHNRKPISYLCSIIFL